MSANPDLLRGRSVSDVTADQLPFIFFVLKPSSQARMLTDREREIALFQFEAHSFSRKGQKEASFNASDQGKIFDLLEEMFLKNTKQDPTKMVRLVEPHTECNCHGWIFASGQFGIDNPYVALILEDN